MTFITNERVDVNGASGSYTVDHTSKNMEQKTTITKTVELIVVRRGADRTVKTTVFTMGEETHYTFPMTNVVRVAKRTTIEEVIYDSYEVEREEAIANYYSIKSQRKPRRKETQPRDICVSSCCGAPHRHQSHLDGYCYDCRPVEPSQS